MAIVGRNEQCPCGSGRKYKRCCGFDHATERALEDRLGALEELARLAYRSPRLVPDSDAYDDSVRAIVAGEASLDIDSAVKAVGDDEAVRIVTACFELFPDEWSALAELAGNEREACGALLGGAVAAGIRDFHPVDRFRVETVDASHVLAGDPFEALALCLEGPALWDERDGWEVDRAINGIPGWVDDEEYERRWSAVLAALAPRLMTPWHERRLARLVGRVDRQLPFDGFPRASAAVRAGCNRFAVETEFRRRLAATLLGDMVGRNLMRGFRASLAA